MRRGLDLIGPLLELPHDADDLVDHGLGRLDHSLHGDPHADGIASADEPADKRLVDDAHFRGAGNIPEGEGAAGHHRDVERLDTAVSSEACSMKVAIEYPWRGPGAAGVAISGLPGWHAPCFSCRGEVLMTRQALAGGILAVAVAGSACSEQTEQRAEDAARATGAAVQSAAADTVRNAERVGEAAADAVRTSDVGGAAQAAIETLDVKAALMADKRVDASGIDVDTDHKTKTVTLKGHVPSTDQRLTAEEIAREKAKGYSINNELVVQPPAKK
jgi:osmotically-inducible protein OsmY